MKFNNLTFFLLFLTVLTVNLKANDNRLILRLQRPPESVLASLDENISQKAPEEFFSGFDNQTPEQGAKKLFKQTRIQRPVIDTRGLLGIYAGYYGYSDEEGFSFPLRHQADKIHLVISPRIKAAPQVANTISHLENHLQNEESDNILIPDVLIPDGITAEQYSFELKKDDNGISFWHVEKEAIPEDNKLSQISFIIITKPSNIYVQTGDFMAYATENLILPQAIYVVGGDDSAKTTLSFLAPDCGRFFEPLEKVRLHLAQPDDSSEETTSTSMTTTTLITNE